MSAVHITHPRCAGVDVHKKSVVVCVITPEGETVRTFGTMTPDLLTLHDWLTEQQVSHVAMESTGVYWKPVWNVLEGSFTLVLANAQHIKAVPGRKTDVRDCEWIADLLRHGLLRPSFVPERPQRELRDLTRYRASVVFQRSAEVNRLHKALEDANIKLGAVATDIMGLSAQAMLQALVAGTTDAAAMADLAKGKLRTKLPALEQALAGRFGDHHRFLLSCHLSLIDSYDALIEQVEVEIAARLRSLDETLDRLDAIPGVNRRAAAAIVAEIGTDMSRFPTHMHLASWAKLCPGTHESAGKRKSSRTGKGNRWLRRMLLQCAHAAAHSTDSYLAAQYRRVAARRGDKRAAVAVAHSILVTIYYLLQRGSTYRDLGGDYFDQRDQETTIRNAVRRLEHLGLKVTLAAA